MAQRQGAGITRLDQMVPLATLLSRELKNEKVERPILRWGQAGQPKKGEDFAFIKEDCQRIPGDGSSVFGVFAIFDGHNGSAAAIYAKDNLLNDVVSAIQPGLNREEWLSALPRALVAGFVKTDKEFQSREQSSGTTVTFVVVDGWTVTVASVGDSRCILVSQDGEVTCLTVDHRLEVNAEERERVTASGGEVGRLSTVGGAEIGPLRCWPGGLCLSRSIGDMDVGEFIVPIPHVKQIKLSKAGGRLIIASDGVWDALASEKGAKCCRGLTPELAAKHIVKEALRTRGLRDDTTCVVVDIEPPSRLTIPSKPKKRGFFSLLFGVRSRKSSTRASEKSAEVGAVEEIFEEGSAMLAESEQLIRMRKKGVLPPFWRVGSSYRGRCLTYSNVVHGDPVDLEVSLLIPQMDSGSKASDGLMLVGDGSVHGMSGLFVCAICQVDLSPDEGISVHAGSFFSTSAKPWEGPFLCSSCKEKKDAMEGKRPTAGNRMDRMWGLAYLASIKRKADPEPV